MAVHLVRCEQMSSGPIERTYDRPNLGQHKFLLCKINEFYWVNDRNMSDGLITGREMNQRQLYHIQTPQHD